MADSPFIGETDFDSPFYYFIDAVRVLSHDPETQCREKQNYNAGWEIQHDVMRRAEIVLGSPLSYLTDNQKEKICGLVRHLKDLSQEVIEPKNVALTTETGCIATMSHPAWRPMRERATELLGLLEWAIKCNEDALR
jgi:hypothetical protein